MKRGVDYAWGGPIPPAVLRRAGVQFVGRYLSNDPSKDINASEYEHLRAHGIGAVVVWESTASRALQGRAAGAQDAARAEQLAAACGLPATQPIHLAIDFDATGPDVQEYFAGAHSVLTGRTGAYGGYKPLKHLFDHGLIGHGWQTYAWSDGKWDPRALVRQYSNGHQLAGVEVDYDLMLNQQGPYVPTDEREWTHEYDQLLALNANHHQVRARLIHQLRQRMLDRRKQIWHLAHHQPNGWKTLNREARWRALVDRTE